MGLDVARLLPEHMKALALRAGSQPREGADESDGSVASNPIVRFLADALRFYMEFHEQYDGFYGAFVHDPFAVAAALDRSLVRTQAVAVDVELAGALTTAETVTDWRGVWGRVPNADVAVDGDAATFLERFVERVGGLAASR
jgi:inosine-uridine nucleoside N-ribohydrolase